MSDDTAALRPELEAGLGALALDPALATPLLDYVALLALWNSTYNLTAVRDPREMLAKHLLDSLAMQPFVRGLLGLGLHDGFRLHHDDAGIFSWWDYRQAAFRRNLGLRIDLTLVSDALKADALAAGIDRTPRTWERASDHTPAWVQLAMT